MNASPIFPYPAEARPTGTPDRDYPEEVLRSAWNPEIENPWWRRPRHAPSPRRRQLPVQPLVLVDGLLDEIGTA